MPLPMLEEVFKISGVPTHTFVEPYGFESVKVSLRTPGRGLIVEGPSGIGKSTAVTRALEAIGQAAATKLSARIPQDVEYISILPDLDRFGMVVVDDFHRLPDALRAAIADLMKVLADTEDPANKVVIVGINRAGESLVAHAPDLVNRIDTIRFETETPSQIIRMVTLGEEALNIRIDAKEQVAEAAHGSFYIAQLLCHELCLRSRVLERQEERTVVSASYSAARRSVLDRQEIRFGSVVKKFARGNKFRPSGRAPYLHILQWLRDAETWSISMRDEIALHPAERISVSQVVDKGPLATLVATEGIADLIHYDQQTRVLSIEDPNLAYYLRNFDWPQFVRDVGFLSFKTESAYDVALSFAGEDRAFAERLYDYLTDANLAVFYDFAEQHRILATNVAQYLAPIYESDAEFVVAVLGRTYGERRWTIFESEAFKSRIDDGRVIPIWSTQVPSSAFDKTREIGGMRFDPDGDIDDQAKRCADTIARKVEDILSQRLPLT